MELDYILDIVICTHGSVCVNVGDRVTTGTKVGKMGNTGNSTGTHLHLEASTTQSWQCSTFVDPLGALGIPNVRGTIINYDGENPPDPPQPPEPPQPIKKKKKYKTPLIFTKRLDIYF